MKMTFALSSLLLVSLAACKAPAQPGDPAFAEPPSNTQPAASQTAAEQLDGYTVIKAKQADGSETSISVKAPPGMQVIGRPDADPHAGNFPLTEALAGLPTKGTLTATLKTSLGNIECELFEDKAPNTVANFVGVARGLRKVLDTRSGAWTARKHYDGTTFHRVIPTFMIQGGDYMGDGSGFTGYTIADELHPTLKHDRGGQLCMANRGPNTNSTQFFITEAAAPHLDNSYTIFGQCQPLDVVMRIARVPQGPGNRPMTPVVIERVEITRREGGTRAANAATPPHVGGMPAIPPGVHVAKKVGPMHEVPSKTP